MAQTLTTTTLKKRKRTQTAEAGSRGAQPVQEISSLVGSTRTPRKTRTSICSTSGNLPGNRQPFHESNPSLESTRTTRKTRSIKGSASVNQPEDTQLVQEINLSPSSTRTTKARSTKASASADQLKDTQPIQAANASPRSARTTRKNQTTKDSTRVTRTTRLKDTQPIQETNVSPRSTRTTRKNQTIKDSTRAARKTRLKDTQPIQETNVSPRSARMGKKRASTRQNEKAPASEIKPADVGDEIHNIPSPKRTKVLTLIKAALRDQPVSLAFWALCYVAPIDRLQRLAKLPRDLLDPYVGFVANLPLQWNQKFREPGETVPQLPEGSKKRKRNNDTSAAGRSLKAVENCKVRDGGVCVLTKNGDPEAAHIFPFCMISPLPTSTKRTSTRFDIWQSLRIFWGEDRVEKWRNTIFQEPENPDVGVEGCFNLISLSPEAHNMWNQGMFALMPLTLSDDRKELTVQFFWQILGNYEIGTKIDLLTKPTSSKGLKGTTKKSIEFNLCRWVRRGVNQPIKSGDIFTFTTSDPDKLPLPSWELLEMQWALTRVVGMCGAAEWPDLEDSDDDDDMADYGVSEYARHISAQRVHDWPFDGKAADLPECSTPTPNRSTSSPAPWVDCH